MGLSMSSVKPPSELGEVLLSWSKTQWEAVTLMSDEEVDNLIKKYGVEGKKCERESAIVLNALWEKVKQKEKEYLEAIKALVEMETRLEKKKEQADVNCNGLCGTAALKGDTHGINSDRNLVQAKVELDSEMIKVQALEENSVTDARINVVKPLVTTSCEDQCSSKELNGRLSNENINSWSGRKKVKYQRGVPRYKTRKKKAKLERQGKLGHEFYAKRNANKKEKMKLAIPPKPPEILLYRDNRELEDNILFCEQEDPSAKLQLSNKLEKQEVAEKWHGQIIGVPLVHFETNLPIFTGDPNYPFAIWERQFILWLEIKENPPDAQKSLALLTFHLDGMALFYYNSLSPLMKTNFKAVRDALRLRFPGILAKKIAQQQLLQCKQEINESVHNFSTRLVNLVQLAMINEPLEIVNRMLMYYFLGKLLPEIFLEIQGINIDTFEDALLKAYEAENMMNLKEQLTRQKKTHSSCLLISEIQCYKCKKYGHIRKQCRNNISRKEHAWQTLRLSGFLRDESRGTSCNARIRRQQPQAFLKKGREIVRYELRC
jgi:hypothetical protein